MKTMWDITDFTLVKILQHGDGEQVYLVRQKKKDDKKKMKKKNPLLILKWAHTNLRKMEMEACVFEHLERLSFVIPYLGRVYSKTDPDFFGILEAYADGDLKWRFAPDSTDALIFMHQLIVAAVELHRRGVVHKDLRPSNVAYNKQSRTITIIDFGCADTNKRIRCSRSNCGAKMLMRDVYVKIDEEIVRAIRDYHPTDAEYFRVERAFKAPFEMVLMQENLYIADLLRIHTPHLTDAIPEFVDDAALLHIAATIRQKLQRIDIHVMDDKDVPKKRRKSSRAVYERLEKRFYASVYKNAPAALLKLRDETTIGH